jgi:hypothetical protein
MNAYMKETLLRLYFKSTMGKDLFFFSLLSNAFCFVILILVSDEALWKRPSIDETNFQF